MANQHAHDWTPEREALAKRLYIDEGLSGPKVAAELGVSKNAVAGLAFRRGWKRSQETTRQSKSASGRAGARAGGKRAPWHSPTPPEVLEERRKGVHVAAAPASAEAKTLMQLGAGECRFPVGDAAGGEQLFCGQPTQGAGSYCPGCRLTRNLTTTSRRDVAREDRHLLRWIDHSERLIARS